MKRKKAKKKAKKRERTTLHTIEVRLSREHTAYVDEIAEYACVSRDVVCAVMMATGIFQAKRYRLPDKAQDTMSQQAATILEQEAKLMRCRKVMEANDPGNALDIFGPPTEPEPPGLHDKPQAAEVAP